MRVSRSIPVAAILTFLAATSAAAQPTVRVGLLSCDISPGIGLIFVQKQTMACTFRPDGGGPVERYAGTIAEYGIELGGVERGHLVWGVFAAVQGVPSGALAGTYSGVGANASFIAGGGASVLLGGSGRAFSLQPLSVEGQIGVNLSAGVRTIHLTPAL